VGPDDALAAELVGVAASRRLRSGYAESSVVLERAALLGSDPEVASERLALAVEDAFLAGDAQRARSLAAAVLGSPASVRTRGHVQLTLGTIEMYAGSVRRSAGLLLAAADGCDGLQRVWALTELAEARFRLGEYGHLQTTARRITDVADLTDPQQRLLSSFVQGIALSSAGDPVAGAARFEDVVRLATGQLTMDNPRLLIPWAMAIAHLGIGDSVMTDADPVLRDARRRGAIGILVPLLSMSAAARAWLGDQAGAFADAGEATELGEHLGYAADTAVALEMLAWQSAARGRHDEARVALERAVALTDRAETTSVHAHHAITAAFCALSRHEPAEAADLLEQRIAADGGIGSMGEPLGVAPQLIEAYAALGRSADSAALARRYVTETQPVSAHDRALVERSLALSAADDDTAVAAYEQALVAHAEDTNRFEAARTRLLYGERLRRAGRRVDARVQLRAALDEFAASDLLAWANRAAQELDATGATARSRGPVPEEPLTSQETRVALLVAKGQSNKEVAAALFLSPKTVEHHLGSVFRKRGYRSRAELAAALAKSPPG
jgi:DNA-binding CsgD family transcriptional regulator